VKIKELITKLQEFNPEMDVVGLHDPANIYGPYILDVKKMYHDPYGDTSRGIPEENISHEKSENFPGEVAVICIGW